MDWALEGPKSTLTPVVYFMCFPQESRASHQNWSRYGNRSLLSLLARERVKGRRRRMEKWSPESLVSKLNKETISDLKKESSHAAVTPMAALHQSLLMHGVATPEYETHHDCWTEAPLSPSERLHLVSAHYKWANLMVTNTPVYYWRLPGSGYHISIRHLTLVKGTRVSPFR